MKTRLFTRKRALISSVAMLLVAMIALGTATFAWFTKSTTATADGIKVQTIKASELVISKLDKKWTTKIEYGQTTAKTLLPISSADGINWYSANATTKTAFGATSATKEDDLGNYVFAEQLNVKNAGQATVTDVKISFELTDAVAQGYTDAEDNTNTSAGKYLRIALVDVTDVANADQANKKVNPTAENFRAGVFDEDGVVYTGVGAIDCTGTDITPENTTYEVNVGELTSNQAKYYNLYVWFEGNDVDCFDYTAGASLGDIDFTVTGKTVDQV